MKTVWNVFNFCFHSTRNIAQGDKPVPLGLAPQLKWGFDLLKNDDQDSKPFIYRPRGLDGGSAARYCELRGILRGKRAPVEEPRDAQQNACSLLGCRRRRRVAHVKSHILVQWDHAEGRSGTGHSSPNTTQ